MWIIPDGDLYEGFDISALYDKSCIKSLRFDKPKEWLEAPPFTVDFSRVNGLETAYVNSDIIINYNKVETLKALLISKYKDADLTNMFSSKELDTLLIGESDIVTLDGIDTSDKIQCVYLVRNQSLADISALCRVKDTLKALCIQDCSKIKNIPDVLSELKNLEYLKISGNKTLPSLKFIDEIDSLSTLELDMNVKDGDLSPCKRLSYASIYTERKHYNMTNDMLPKGTIVYGNENIESWRRF